MDISCDNHPLMLQRYNKNDAILSIIIVQQRDHIQVTNIPQCKFKQEKQYFFVIVLYLNDEMQPAGLLSSGWLVLTGLASSVDGKILYHHH